MELQLLFKEAIMEQSALHSNASDIWLVKTNAGEFIVRSSGVNDEVDAPFVWACRNLFGIELSNTFDLEFINDSVGRLTNMKIPKVINKAIIEGRQFVVVEKIGGMNFDFKDKPAKMMEEFGKSMAYIHSHEFTSWGAPAGIRYSLETFPSRLKDAVRILASRYYGTNQPIHHRLEYILKQLEKLQPPQTTAYVMLDMDARQFFSDGERVQAIIDTEAYVIGPCELDLVALEFSLDDFGAMSFKKGYSSVIPFPDLTGVREIYRFLFCLLEIKGPAFKLDHWIEKPHLFDAALYIS